MSRHNKLRREMYATGKFGVRYNNEKNVKRDKMKRHDVTKYIPVCRMPEGENWCPLRPWSSTSQCMDYIHMAQRVTGFGRSSPLCDDTEDTTGLLPGPHRGTLLFVAMVAQFPNLSLPLVSITKTSLHQLHRGSWSTMVLICKH